MQNLTEIDFTKYIDRVSKYENIEPGMTNFLSFKNMVETHNISFTIINEYPLPWRCTYCGIVISINNMGMMNVICHMAPATIDPDGSEWVNINYQHGIMYGNQCMQTEKEEAHKLFSTLKEIKFKNIVDESIFKYVPIEVRVTILNNYLTVF